MHGIYYANYYSKASLLLRLGWGEVVHSYAIQSLLYGDTIKRELEVIGRQGMPHSRACAVRVALNSLPVSIPCYLSSNHNHHNCSKRQKVLNVGGVCVDHEASVCVTYTHRMDR